MPEAPDARERDPVPTGTEPARPDGPPAMPVTLELVAVGELAAHPGNVREDLDVSKEFVASVADSGVLVPLLITSADGDGGVGYRVVEGHRRLAAAIQAGLDHVPCIIDPGRAADQARQFLDMALANSSHYRKNFTAAEEAAALFAAHEAGASRTRIRKTTGRKADEVKAALAVGGISAQTREAAGELTRQLSLDQLALLAEFDGDADAVERILMSLRLGYGTEHAAERIRQERAEAAKHDELVAELQAGGFAVTDLLPPGAVRVTGLQHDGEDLTSLAHASCHGRGVYFPAWDKLNPVHYCASPEENGHTSRSYASLSARAFGDGSALAGGAESGPLPAPSSEADPDPDRRLVIEGNKAWAAATTVRHRWLASELFARRSAPREAARFAARQLLTMPVPLHRGLVSAPTRQLFEEITRQDAAAWLEICDTTASARLPLLILAPVVIAYELAMTEAEGRNTWRIDRYSPCPREDAGVYLKFLATAGYQLSAIEQAVADGVPYVGDEPGPPPPEPKSAADDPGITAAADLAGVGQEPGEDAAADDRADVTGPGDFSDPGTSVAA